MRTIQSRSGVALLVALTLATVLVSPGPPAYADDESELEDVGKVKRGEKNVVVRANVKKADLVCNLKIKYADGNTDTVGETKSDKKGICEISFDLPDRRSIVGEATAKLKVETKDGSDRGKASRNFTVRDRRGG